MTSVDVSITVDKGEPLDYPQYRHTALYFEFADGSRPLLAQVTGPKNNFQFECREAESPFEALRHAKTIHVGTLAVRMTPQQLISALREVPVKNDDYDFDCQKWVEDALSKFKAAGQLSGKAYERGLDGMVDAVMEAEDVEEE